MPFWKVASGRLESDLDSVVRALPNEALPKLCKLVFERLVVAAQGTSRHREAWIEGYKFTSDFAELVALSTPMVEQREFEPLIPCLQKVRSYVFIAVATLKLRTVQGGVTERKSSQGLNSRGHFETRPCRR